MAVRVEDEEGRGVPTILHGGTEWPTGQWLNKIPSQRPELTTYDRKDGVVLNEAAPTVCFWVVFFIIIKRRVCVSEQAAKARSLTQKAEEPSTRTRRCSGFFFPLSFLFTLVFYGHLHKHEHSSCHKTFPPLVRGGGGTRQSKVHRLYKHDHLKSNYRSIKANLWARLELS